ncbi:IS3 family transposase, partial [Aeromonas schubertii]|nr:IS3 family transposase [Aeromonas schubertii]
MTKATIEQKTPRTRYSQQYKEEALALAERVGMSKAAIQLGLKEAQL